MLKFFMRDFGPELGHEVVGPHRSPDQVGSQIAGNFVKDISFRKL